MHREINIQTYQHRNEYLRKYGFELGDFVKVEVSKNKIVIQKKTQAPNYQTLWALKTPHF